MDNLTHSLVGALIGQMGMKRKTGLAMPTLIIAANIPDIDAVATLLGGHQHLAIRRGISHGPIAMVVLPLMLWGIMLWFDRWQARRGKRPDKRLPIHKGWLLALAYVGCLSHPLFDWFNSYGIRLLEPFSSQWFYGDTLFIIDIWLWAALIAGVWMSFRQERQMSPNWRSPALASFFVLCGYLLANGLITGRAERLTAESVEQQYGMVPTLVVANPVPVQFWKREMLWRTPLVYGVGYYSLGEMPKMQGQPRRHNAESFYFTPTPEELIDFNAFLFWSRMPVFVTSGGKLSVSDQRFENPLVRDQFKVVVSVE
jgi:inner membrane protein